jgi:ribosomal protein S18 acetylase RimI-like enzyme
VEDREAVRPFLERDPVGNAVTWDRALQQENYEVYAEGEPFEGVLAIQRARRADRPNIIALHAANAEAAGALTALLPKGFTLMHLTEEFPLAVLEPRAADFHPLPAWLFRLDAKDFVDYPNPQVRSLEPSFAGLVARLWDPDWPAEGYVRRRIENGPTAALYEDGDPIAWALTHMVTNRVGVIGMVHVKEGFRRKGLARSVVAAVSRELFQEGKIPALHAYVDNAASLSLFPTLGFRRVRRQVWGDAVFR